ncbi:metal ABC transporter solute-binding protein, Zn/Mn family [Protaetiibacter larvae]|uniref:ABC transporter substrate-binding protein n=1 Tax=Protaetiibacter larvae TaxID=2592654 RepID=A0A5C1Y861_9MICO|nr:zinc ABC transporter substrate-binding protein [Protaetiibacter larvae]QEO09415.1 ABC transporter substrate-binding protein [Protaetiibacter larvae]
MLRRPAPLAAALTLLVAAAALTGCATTPDAVDDGTIRIVASTNVYGDIARTIAGDDAEITSLIHDSAQDPHEFEATPRDALAVSQADIVIVNGGGYDDFMGSLLEQASSPVVLDAVELSGLDTEPADGEFNEHVWYHFDTVAAVADAIADAVAELEPAEADAAEARAAQFRTGLDALAARAADIAADHGGAGVAVTEPVPLYLLEAAGLENRTPSEFSEAVEEGTDAPALVLEAMIALVGDGSVALLAYNEQTVGPQTEQVLAAAQDAGTPVVSFTELLPDGEDYLSWMGANLDAVEAALAG